MTKLEHLVVLFLGTFLLLFFFRGVRALRAYSKKLAAAVLSLSATLLVIQVFELHVEARLSGFLTNS